MKKTISIALLSLAVASCSSSNSSEELTDWEKLNAESNSLDLVKEQKVEKLEYLSAQTDMRRQYMFHFDFDKSEINEENKAALNAHAEYLVANRSVTVFVAGGTDEVAGREYNTELSNKRSVNIKKYLESQGVLSGQIIIKGLGETRHLDYTQSPKGDSLNRRVTLIY